MHTRVEPLCTTGLCTTGLRGFKASRFSVRASFVHRLSRAPLACGRCSETTDIAPLGSML